LGGRGLAADSRALGVGRRAELRAVMSYPRREHMKRALWHAKAAIGCLRKAADVVGIDIDEPLQESGLIPPPPEQDVSGPDFIEPTVFDDEVDDNPQGKRAAYLRLIKSAAAIRSW
jgi:hypothetical protein